MRPASDGDRRARRQDRPGGDGESAVEPPAVDEATSGMDGERERLLEQQRTLEERLTKGEQMVREAREAGDEALATRLERHWLSLLAEYEAVSARLEGLEPAS